MRMGLIRNHYVGRTFIEPQQSIRHFGVRVKLNPVRSILEGKRVVLVDDSIVRGTTSRKIVRMVRGAGAREVHMRISCPPTISPCFYGVDTPQTVRIDSRDAYARRDTQVPRCGQHRVFESRGADRRASTGGEAAIARRAIPGFIPSRSRATRRHTCSLRSSSTLSRSRWNPQTSCSRRWKRIQSRADVPCRHAFWSRFSWSPRQSTLPQRRAALRPAIFRRNIDTLSSFDYPTRMNAARALRRVAPAEVVPALIEAARRHRRRVRPLSRSHRPYLVQRSRHAGAHAGASAGSQRSGPRGCIPVV